METSFFEPTTLGSNGSHLVYDYASLREQLRSSWSYRDVLALALAKAEGVRFTANPIRWNQTIAKLKEQTRDSAPRLLEDVLFDRRDPSAPYSDQVESFLASMRRARVLRRSNQGDDTYEIAPEDKEDLVTHQSPAFIDYDDIIAQMAKEIDASLTLQSNGRH